LKKKDSAERIYWVDLARGLAVVLMLIYHFVFDLSYLGMVETAMYSGIWLVIARIIQFTFLFLAGISLFLSYEQKQEGYAKYQLTRGLKLMVIAIGITAITWLLFPGDYIRFGILHLISIGIITGSLITHDPIMAIPIAIVVFLLGPVFQSMQVTNSLLLIFGAIPPEFTSLDYFPIFPWLGIIFLGIGLAPMLKKWGLFKKGSKEKPIISFLGQNSLIIYLVHQPIIIGALLLIRPFFGG